MEIKFERKAEVPRRERDSDTPRTITRDSSVALPMLHWGNKLWATIAVDCDCHARSPAQTFQAFCSLRRPTVTVNSDVKFSHRESNLSAQAQARQRAGCYHHLLDLTLADNSGSIKVCVGTGARSLVALNIFNLLLATHPTPSPLGDFFLRRLWAKARESGKLKKTTERTQRHRRKEGVKVVTERSRPPLWLVVCVCVCVCEQRFKWEITVERGLSRHRILGELTFLGPLVSLLIRFGIFFSVPRVTFQLARHFSDLSGFVRRFCVLLLLEINLVLRATARAWDEISKQKSFLLRSKLRLCARCNIDEQRRLRNGTLKGFLLMKNQILVKNAREASVIVAFVASEKKFLPCAKPRNIPSS